MLAKVRGQSTQVKDWIEFLQLSTGTDVIKIAAITVGGVAARYLNSQNIANSSTDDVFLMSTRFRPIMTVSKISWGSAIGCRELGFILTWISFPTEAYWSGTLCATKIFTLKECSIGIVGRTRMDDSQLKCMLQ